MTLWIAPVISSLLEHRDLYYQKNSKCSTVCMYISIANSRPKLESFLLTLQNDMRRMSGLYVKQLLISFQIILLILYVTRLICLSEAFRGVFWLVKSVGILHAVKTREH